MRPEIAPIRTTRRSRGRTTGSLALRTSLGQGLNGARRPARTAQWVSATMAPTPGRPRRRCGRPAAAPEDAHVSLPGPRSRCADAGEIHAGELILPAPRRSLLERILVASQLAHARPVVVRNAAPGDDTSTAHTDPPGDLRGQAVHAQLTKRRGGATAVRDPILGRAIDEAEDLAPRRVASAAAVCESGGSEVVGGEPSASRRQALPASIRRSARRTPAPAAITVRTRD